MSACCTTRSCCDNPECRRKTPILVRREHFTGRWVAITRHTHQGDVVRASEKHTLDVVSQAEIELRGSVLSALFETVRDRWETAVEGSEAEAAYRVVLDRLDELEKAKLAELGIAVERAS